VIGLDKPKKGVISRKDFLQSSTVLTAGLTFLPGSLQSLFQSGKGSKSLQNIDYAVIYRQSNKNNTEEKAARKLSEYLAKAGFDIPVSDEESYKGNQGVFEYASSAKWHQTILPEFIEYQLSVDGENYEDPIRIDKPYDPNPDINPGITNVRVQPFKADIGLKDARYIKVHAESPIEMPSWHIRAGSPAKIYTDEIVVN